MKKVLTKVWLNSSRSRDTRIGDSGLEYRVRAEQIACETSLTASRRRRGPGDPFGLLFRASDEVYDGTKGRVVGDRHVMMMAK